MLEALKLVKGAVDTKNLVPVLTHFHIDGGHVQGGNGRVTIQSEVAGLAGFNKVTVHAARFVDAIESCGDVEPVLSVDDQYVYFKAGRFKCKIDRIAPELVDTYPVDEPDVLCTAGLTEPILPTLKIIREFVSEDASRPWSIGAWFHNNYVYGTNNVVIARKPLGFPASSMNVPNYVVDELLRISREPHEVAFSATSITFFYKDGTWLKGRLLVQEWPAVHEWFTPQLEVTALPKLPPGLLEAVRQCAAFVSDKKNPVVQFKDEAVVCGNASTSGFKLPEGTYRLEPLELVLQHAARADFSTYPGKVYWRGKDGIAGFFVGVRT